MLRSKHLFNYTNSVTIDVFIYTLVCYFFGLFFSKYSFNRVKRWVLKYNLLLSPAIFQCLFLTYISYLFFVFLILMPCDQCVILPLTQTDGFVACVVALCALQWPWQNFNPVPKWRIIDTLNVFDVTENVRVRVSVTTKLNGTAGNAFHFYLICVHILCNRNRSRRACVCHTVTAKLYGEAGNAFRSCDYLILACDSFKSLSLFIYCDIVNLTRPGLGALL